MVEEKGPKFIGYSKNNVLTYGVGKDVLLFGNPLLIGFYPAGGATAFLLQL